MKIKLQRFVKVKDLKAAAKKNEWPTMYQLVDQQHLDSGEYVRVTITIEQDR